MGGEFFLGIGGRFWIPTLALRILLTPLTRSVRSSPNGLLDRLLILPLMIQNVPSSIMMALKKTAIISGRYESIAPGISDSDVISAILIHQMLVQPCQENPVHLIR